MHTDDFDEITKEIASANEEQNDLAYELLKYLYNMRMYTEYLRMLDAKNGGTSDEMFRAKDMYYALIDHRAAIVRRVIGQKDELENALKPYKRVLDNMWKT